MPGLELCLPAEATQDERVAFARLCRLLAGRQEAAQPRRTHRQWLEVARLGDLYSQPVLCAAVHTVIDLADQGWTIEALPSGSTFTAPTAHQDQAREKQRVRDQEHLRRDEQLRKPSVRRFVDRMERVHSHGGELISIFNLMRDGKELLAAFLKDPSGRTAIQPYVQIVDDGVCDRTGFKLHDIWRYFRHTWSSAYATVPGRSMPILVRDAATPHHAVIGLAAISSPVMQIAQRDEWMGWDSEGMVQDLRSRPSDAVAEWVAARIESDIAEIHTGDLFRDGVISPGDLRDPTPDVVSRLQIDAERYRLRHHRSAVLRQVRSIGADHWIQRAETDLFRGKRAAALADALQARLSVEPYLRPRATPEGLRRALDDKHALRSVRRLLRRARGERVGTVIADLTVCGAVAPYSALAAGKLVGALAVSPTVLRAYAEKYSRPSEIASSMAGRPITREARLAVITTTSLYGVGSSQYNRLFWPAAILGGPPDKRSGFYKVGRSRSFGTSHLSPQTIDALVRLSAHQGSTVRVNNLFGEGVSPRLRKARLGLASLGWPSDELLKHRRERIVYAVPLVRNVRDYSLGIDSEPDYLLDIGIEDSDSRIAAWWLGRWALRRAETSAVREDIGCQRLERPVVHAARVHLPPIDEHGDQLVLDA